jgi:hypothetical protein
MTALLAAGHVGTGVLADRARRRCWVRFEPARRAR